MSTKRKFLSVKYQLFVCLGFFTIFAGLLLQFYSETYPMLRTFKLLFIIVDCIGGAMIFLTLFFAYYLNRKNLSEIGRPLIIESLITFSFNFSYQAIVFHYLFNKNIVPVNLGIFFTFIAYFLFFVPLLFCLNLSLFKDYYPVLVILISFIAIGTLISGIFLTFTGASDQITGSGIELLALGSISIVFLIIVFIFYPKWKPVLLADENEEEEEENEEDEDKIEL